MCYTFSPLPFPPPLLPSALPPALRAPNLLIKMRRK